MSSQRTVMEALRAAEQAKLDKIAEAEAAAKKKRMRQFSWFRVHHKVVDDDERWRLAARIAGAPLHLVEAFWLRLERFASSNLPRGSLSGFSIRRLAAHWNFADEDLLARIYAALEDPEVGWIDQDYVVSFHERNPDLEDPTAAERQKKHRDKIRRAAEARKARALARPATYPQSRVTARDNRDVTHISDQIIKQAGGAVSEKAAFDEPGGAAPGLSEEDSRLAPRATQAPADNGNNGESVAPGAQAELWLATAGKRIVVERLDVPATLAATRIERWLGAVNGDHAALAAIIAAAERQDYIGARFHNLIVDQIKRCAHQSDGQRTLPLPPAPLTTKKATGT